MIIGKNRTFIELSNKKAVFWKYNRLGNKNKPYIKTMGDTPGKELKTFKSRGFKGEYLILTEEEVLIKDMSLPMSRKGKLENLVRNELVYLFKNIEGILYTFVKTGGSQNTAEVLVYCLHSKSFNFFRTNERVASKAKGIFSIQFLFFKFFSERIPLMDYLMIFSHNRHLYLNACMKGNLLANHVVKEYELEDFLLYLEIFLKKYNLSESLKEKTLKIYMINVFKEEDKNNLRSVSCYDYEIITNVKTSDVIFEVLSKKRLYKL